MCFKEAFKDWKIILKVSIIVAVIFFIGELVIGDLLMKGIVFNLKYSIDDPLGWIIVRLVANLNTLVFLIGSLIVTSLILHRKLKDNDWGILLGAIAVLLFYPVVKLILFKSTDIVYDLFFR